MDNNDWNELRNEIDMLQQQSQSCATQECEEDNYEDYPDYLRAIYHEVLPPFKSGIYISRWDLKMIAAKVGESFTLDVRERMFRKFMQWIATAEDMRTVIDAFNAHFDDKCELYAEYGQKYPATQPIFDEKIKKAQKAKAYFEKVYVEFFT